MRSSASAFTAWRSRNRVSSSKRSKMPPKWHGFDAGISGACGPVTPAPPSTRTRGPGTRWVSGVPPTHRGYKNMGIDRREEWERPEDDAEGSGSVGAAPGIGQTGP